ncbi:UDP-4-amino-4-deoxy-L-arabinose--oxoglutarate aminotransferase [subsurface metagenome]
MRNTNTDKKAMNADGIKELGFPMWPQFAEKTLIDIQEPIRTGQVNYWTGKRGMEFEKAFAEWEGSNHAISCTNGTAALHIAISSLNIGPGDTLLIFLILLLLSRSQLPL